MKEQINAVLGEMTNDLRERSARVKEAQAALRQGRNESRGLMRAGADAQKRVDSAEDQFKRTESQLAEANTAFNETVEALREKQKAVNEAEKARKAAEDALFARR